MKPKLKVSVPKVGFIPKQFKRRKLPALVGGAGKPDVVKPPLISGIMSQRLSSKKAWKK